MASMNCGVLQVPVSDQKGDKLPPNLWDQLQEGHCVLVERAGEALLSGEVDVVAPDASIFWVWLDGGRGRIAVYTDEGTAVWLPKDYRL